MKARVPILPTFLVLAAAGVMIRLGFWQIDRLHQKEMLLARYHSALSTAADAPFPVDGKAAELVLYRHATLECARPSGVSAMAGRSAHDEIGFAHTVRCVGPDGAGPLVVLGWSNQPQPVAWSGGTVRGVIAPGPRLVADPPLAGLGATSRPDPRDIPNNHFAYAVQWFLFAGTALVIYALALRKRLRG